MHIFREARLGKEMGWALAAGRLGCTPLDARDRGRVGMGRARW